MTRCRRGHDDTLYMVFHRSASILKGGRVVFNIGGNKYRLILAMDYGRQASYVKFVGTHRQYDAIDAETV